MSTSIEQIRNIGIVAHIDAGKTTTTERILYYTGALHKLGEVDEGTTQTDFDTEEAQRGITIYSAAVTCRWNECQINIIDTPGHVDFTAEVQRSLRVLDGAIVIFSAVEGVEAQSETVWRQADEYGVPRICFINKMDRIGADFERTLAQIEKRLAATPVPVTVPMGAGSPPQPGAFSGIIDLIQMKALYFDAQSKGQDFEIREIPEEFAAYASDWRGKLIDAVSLLDDEIMQAYLEGEEIPTARIHHTLRQAAIHGQLQPLFAGSSLDYCGVQPLLDGVTEYLPSPLDRPPVEGVHPHPKKDAREIRKPDTSAPFCGLVFKIVADQHTDLAFLRVYSGVLKSGSRMLNPRTGKKELISQLWHIQADQREKPGERPGRGGRHRGSHWLEVLRDGRHPLRSQAAAAVGADHVSGNGHLHGGGAGLLRGKKETRRSACAAGQARSDVQRPAQRRDRPDHHQRHGRTAPGSPPQPSGARLSPENARPQAARQLSRDGHQRGRGRWRVPPDQGG